MALLNDQIRQQVSEVLAGMDRPVKLLLFVREDGETTEQECAACEDTRSLIEEVAGLSEKIQVEVRDLVKDAALAQQYRVDKVPALVPLAQDGTDYRIRLYGIPSGYEFSSLIEDILLVSRGKYGLSPKTMEQIGRLDRPVHIQVYVTPT